MARICFLCQKEVEGGKQVIDDYVIKALRYLKQLTKTYRGNTLVVCSECEKEYEKKRKSFEHTLLMYVAAAILIGVFFLLIRFSLISLLFGVALIVFALFLSLFHYVPAIEKKSG